MSKNIVIFSDGTCQKGGEGFNTNIYKLFNIIEDRTKNQIAYYDPGVGTNGKSITGALFGNGLSKNIVECYTFIFEHFEAGDQIYLFGFSRGAATVRSLSSLIHHFGILPKSRPDLIEKAFNIYKKSSKENITSNAKNFIKKHHTMWTKVRFVGVFDTVAALGFPSKWKAIIFDKLFSHKFHNYELSECIEYARHALSIDDERKTFHPIIWDTIKDGNDKLKQVWFCGVHTDVGGGYEKYNLANISLKWMINEATQKGLILYQKSEALTELQASTQQANGIMNNEQEGFLGGIYKRQQRSWNKDGIPTIHHSVLERTKSTDNKETPSYSPWILTNKYNIEK